MKRAKSTKPAKASSNSEVVSIRLPKPILDKLDAEVQRQDSSRTDIIRAGLALYYASQNSLMVPLSHEYREKLIRMAKVDQLPPLLLAQQMLEKTLDEQNLSIQLPPQSFTLRLASKPAPKLMLRDLTPRVRYGN